MSSLHGHGLLYLAQICDHSPDFMLLWVSQAPAPEAQEAAGLPSPGLAVPGRAEPAASPGPGPGLESLGVHVTSSSPTPGPTEREASLELPAARRPERCRGRGWLFPWDRWGSVSTQSVVMPRWGFTSMTLPPLLAQLPLQRTSHISRNGPWRKPKSWVSLAWPLPHPASVGSNRGHRQAEPRSRGWNLSDNFGSL